MLPLGLGVAVKNVGQHEMSVRQRGTEQGRHPGDLDVARAERLVHGALSPRAGGQLAQAEEEERIMEPGLRFGVRPAPYRFPEPLGERPQAVLIWAYGGAECSSSQKAARSQPSQSAAQSTGTAARNRPRLSRAFGVIRARFLIQ